MHRILLINLLCFFCLICYVEAQTKASPTIAPLNDTTIKELYSEFKNILVNPPHPDSYEQYGINDGEAALLKTRKLLNKINNILFTAPDEEIKRYGELLHVMRDALALDAEHIPLAIKHDNSRDSYWYDLHTKWIKKAEDLYNILFNMKTEDK